jgi:nitronate monooxygenase
MNLPVELGWFTLPIDRRNGSCAEAYLMLRTRLTERFRLEHPVVLAPMAFAGGGRLAAAVAAAGGLGLIGGGYGSEGWLREQISAAGNERVGCGFITWSLKKQPHLLEIALEHLPAAMFLSFGDPQPFAVRIKEAGVPLFCQVQTMADARRAIEVGADVVVAQGSEAGGHGSRRGTFSLVPEVADLITAEAPDTLLCAAGGIADGRGVAAALALGADGVVVGTRFVATEEALLHPNLKAAIVAASGDETLRSSVIDILKGYDDWPARYDLRTLRSAATDRWHGRDPELRANAEREVRRYAEAAARGDARNVSPTAGEAVGLIHTVSPAGAILRSMVSQAERILETAPSWMRT